MRHAAIALAALLCPAAAGAASVVYEHPALRARLTVHTPDGASAPDALSYEGPKGFYLVTAADLRSLERYDGWINATYGVRALGAAGLSSQEDPYRPAAAYPYSDDSCVAAVEQALSALIGRGKQEAPDEFAARVATLRSAALSTRSLWRSYETSAREVPGSVLDKPALDGAETPLNEALAAIEAARAERVTGEARAASAAATAAEPNPKAAFYWRQGRALDAAAGKLARAGDVVRATPLPAYY